MARVRINAPVPIPGSGGKTIDEHVGLASDGRDAVSVAHMVAPAGWSEPVQTPDFDEVTIVVRGRLAVDGAGTRLEVKAGESLLVERGTAVRYANPFGEPCEYWAVCVPAFSLARAGRSPD